MTHNYNFPISQELFNSILREVRDEVNIPMNELQQPLLMGVAGNAESCDRPTAEFLIR